jgi:hypothetical protein
VSEAVVASREHFEVREAVVAAVAVSMVDVFVVPQASP